MHAPQLPRMSHQDMLSVFERYETFVITSHANPDGDAIGSEYALAHFLLGLGKSVSILNTSPLPENLFFLSTGDGIRQYDPAQHASIVAAADVIIVVDLNDLTRLKTMERDVATRAAVKIVIDHHLHPKPFADGYLLDAESCATAEILYSLFRTHGAEPFSFHVALGLYVGIMTDTGSFRFDRTTPRIHRITAELLECGVDPVTVYRHIYDEYPLQRSRLLGLVLAGIEQVCDGRATILTVSRDMFLDTGTGIEDVENIVNYGLSIRGVHATALLTDLGGEIKISFRSRGSVSIHTVARALGGGGHKYASGASLTGMSLEEAKLLVSEKFSILFQSATE